MGAPVGVSIAASSGNVANANAVATLAGSANRTTYLSGLAFTAAGATVGSVVVATITGLAAGTLSYVFAAPTGATVGAAPFERYFDPPLPASGPNVPIVITLPALGAGNTNSCTSAYGFQI